jgi:cGMP-dependent protein kinase
MKKEHYKQGEAIFNEGAVGNKIYLLFKGKVNIVKNNKKIRELDRGSYFGEISILLNQPRSASVIALTNLTIYTISADFFMKNIDQKILEILRKKMKLLDVDNTELDEFYYIGSLGEGKFGTVSLVHDCRDVYAIKAVLRKRAECQKMLIKYFIKERQILLSLDHPFIVKLVKTMKNKDFIFYLMEHINGIVLSKYLEKRMQNRLYNLYETKFIVACLLTVVDYLNFKNIAHRDIKPDNIMIDERGYLKLIDFGTALEIKDFTTTITGTPHYIAPEVLLGRGYGYSADYWSIGVTAFEVFYNFYPFGNKAKDPMEVYKEVVKK